VKSAQICSIWIYR